MVKTLDKTVLLLITLLPMVVPFGLARNVAGQAIIVCLTGLLAWLSIFYKRREMALPKLLEVFLLIFMLSCLLSLLSNLSFANAFGTPLIRLGSIEILCCLGIGLTLRSTKLSTIIVYLYISTIATALTSVPYTLLHSHSWVRIGGLFFQPDFLAVVAAVGLILGIVAWQRQLINYYLLIVTQLSLLTVVFLTQTRAIIFILSSIILLACGMAKLKWQLKLILGLSTLLFVVLGGIIVAPLGNRLTDSAYASDSISYRFDLQSIGVHHLTDRPLTGYGLAGLQQPLACNKIVAPELLATCEQGYYFDSSHNIFLDRFLALGWLGGTSFAALTICLIGFNLCNRQTQLVGLAGLLILLYYITNITSLEIETLLWILLFQTKIIGD